MFTREQVKNIIFLDGDGKDDAILGNDVSIPICRTTELTRLADAIRVGCKPMDLRPETDYADFDPDGWYDFYAEVKGVDEVNLCFSVDSLQAEDDGQTYNIRLSKDEQANVYKRLDELVRCYKMSLDALLREATQEKKG